jgi:glutaredoxin 3
VNAPQILMYSTPWCPYCAQARALFTAKGVSYQDIDIEAHPEQRAEMIRRSGRRTVPQIFIGERHIGGADDMHELDRAGGLDPLLHSQG